MKYFAQMCITGLFAAVFLNACGGENSDSEAPLDSVFPGNIQVSPEGIQIVGAGIKGPLAFADAKIFVADPSFPDFYDKSSPISSSITDQYAQISGLSVPSNIKPPLILTIGGNQAIDLNTGKPPVITTLVTVVTADILASDRPVYATPLTTLVFHMARHAASANKDIDTFSQELNRASQEVSSRFSVNTDKEINILNPLHHIRSRTEIPLLLLLIHL